MEWRRCFDRSRARYACERFHSFRWRLYKLGCHDSDAAGACSAFQLVPGLLDRIEFRGYPICSRCRSACCGKRSCRIYVVAQVIDAVVLSMSLLGLTLYAVSAVAACLPYTYSLSAPLYKAAETVSEARDTFAQEAMEALDRLQQAIPFLCAANAAATIAANGSASSLSASYVGLAIPLPITSETTRIPKTRRRTKWGRPSRGIIPRFPMPQHVRRKHAKR